MFPQPLRTVITAYGLALAVALGLAGLGAPLWLAALGVWLGGAAVGIVLQRRAARAGRSAADQRLGDLAAWDRDHLAECVPHRPADGAPLKGAHGSQPAPLPADPLQASGAAPRPRAMQTYREARRRVFRRAG